MSDSSQTNIVVRQGSINTQILGIGAYRPRTIVSNEDVCKHIESTPDWIYQRSGIENRRYAEADETVVMMATEAAKKALVSAGIDSSDIDSLILCTSTYPLACPHGAPKVAEQIGRNGIAAMDLSVGCAGFGHGLALASNLIQGGGAKHVMVIGVERMMDGIEKTDRNTAFIFGDGAGAVVVGPSDVNKIGPVVWGSDGEQGDAIRQSISWTEFMADTSQRPQMIMEGNRVFRWAATQVAKVAKATMEAAEVTPEQIQCFIPHQANGRINAALSQNLGLPEGVVIANDIEHTGNTSAASIPLAMEELLRTGKAKEGDVALLVGFGAGLSYAGQVVRLPAAPPAE